MRRGARRDVCTMKLKILSRLTSTCLALLACRLSSVRRSRPRCDPTRGAAAGGAGPPRAFYTRLESVLLFQVGVPAPRDFCWTHSAHGTPCGPNPLTSPRFVRPAPATTSRECGECGRMHAHAARYRRAPRRAWPLDRALRWRLGGPVLGELDVSCPSSVCLSYISFSYLMDGPFGTSVVSSLPGERSFRRRPPPPQRSRAPGRFRRSSVPKTSGSKRCCARSGRRTRGSPCCRQKKNLFRWRCTPRTRRARSRAHFCSHHPHRFMLHNPTCFRCSR